MANPRQRRKAKSSTHRPVSHSKRAKRLLKKMPAIRGPKALQDAWDPSKTVRQNYQALGLKHDLNPIPSGGSEVDASCPIGPANTCQSRPTTSSPAIDGARSSVTSTLPKGFGRIVRDPSGNVIRVELPSDEEARPPLKEALAIDAPLVTTESELRIWTNETGRGGSSGGKEDAIVQGGHGEFVLTISSLAKVLQWLTYGPVDLEKLAASAAVRERHTSFGERLYLERLVSKYGDDLERMARDRRLNPAQRTTSELKRAFSKAGGVGAFCKSTVTKVTE